MHTQPPGRTPSHQRLITELLSNANYFSMYRAFILVLPDVHRISEELAQKHPDPWKLFETSLQQFYRAHSSQSWDRFSLEAWVVRDIDSLLRYITGTLFIVFTNRPECLRTGESITVREALEHATIEELVLTVAERKVHELGYSGLRGIVRYLNEKLGVPSLPSGELLAKAAEFVEARNLIVHNGGIVNKIYLQRTGRKDISEGQLLPLTHDLVLEASRVAQDFATATDAAVVKHFGLTVPSSDQA